MPVKPRKAEIDEPLAIGNALSPAARGWLMVSLGAARAIAEGKRKPRPSRSQHNASLDTIERLADSSIETPTALKRQLYTHYNVWGSAALGPASAHNFADVPLMSALEKIGDAARNARRTGRPPDRRKQQIVDLALAFCARYSPLVPTTSEKNFFRHFAERFYECATGLSVFDRGQGIDRQIKKALRRLPIEKKRASFLDKTRVILA
jgi:hypothetical protein